jgi:3-oxoacyl-[acyl-carrier protein] reductase
MTNRPQVILVTGASRGLGLAICETLLATTSFAVVGASRTESDSFCALAAAHPHRLHYRFLDLASHSSLSAFARIVVAEFGAPFGLVNNGAIARDGLLATQHETEIQELVDTNVTGPLLLTKYVTRTMLAAKTGRVVNVASISADRGFSGLAAYGATKSAMVGLTRNLARELGRAGINVNCVSPGYMPTAMSAGLADDDLERIRRRSPLNRLVTCEEVAAVVAFLLGPGGSGITGAIIPVDAGASS